MTEQSWLQLMFTIQAEYKLVYKSILLTISIHQIWHFVQWWTRITSEWPKPYNIDKKKFDCLKLYWRVLLGNQTENQSWGSTQFRVRVRVGFRMQQQRAKRDNGERQQRDITEIELEERDNRERLQRKMAEKIDSGRWQREMVMGDCITLWGGGDSGDDARDVGTRWYEEMAMKGCRER